MQHVVEAIEKVYEKALAAMKERFVVDGKPSGKKLNMEQLRAHGLAYLATETMACRVPLAALVSFMWTAEPVTEAAIVPRPASALSSRVG